MKTLLFCLSVFVGTSVHAQSPAPWTDADAARYARERTESTLWDMPLLADDLSFSFESLEVAPPVINLPSPVPEYDGAASLLPTQLELPGKRVRGTTFAYVHDAYRPAPANDPLAYYETAFTIYILVDSLYAEEAIGLVLSRNAPHYVAAGKQRTAVGDVSYVEVSPASGENLAIVSRQYFDLRQGSTVLVTPLHDGSLRFMQLADSPGSLRTGEENEAYNATAIDAFEARLEADPAVIEFFTQPGSL